MSYALEAHREANKQLRDLPPKIAEGLRKVLHDLADEPAHPRFDLKPIQGHSRHPPTQRLRIGQYRVLLKIDHEKQRIRVLRIGLRGDVYRGIDHLDQFPNP